jgi:hypothetical protein
MGDRDMSETKLQVPTELRNLAEKAIDQTEQAFGIFFDAANKSMATMPNPATEMSKNALSFTEQNLKAALDLIHPPTFKKPCEFSQNFLEGNFPVLANT